MRLPCDPYFPMQKREKMAWRISGEATVPVMVPRWWRASRMSMTTRSAGRLASSASLTRGRMSKMWRRAS